MGPVMVVVLAGAVLSFLAIATLSVRGFVRERRWRAERRRTVVRGWDVQKRTVRDLLR